MRLYTLKGHLTSHMGRSGSLPLWGVWNCPRKWSTQLQAELSDWLGWADGCVSVTGASLC
eukprot:scaffold24197_cov63-Phaeocystis_antarctica.AAC.1